MSRLRLIVFDVDGTLVDSQGLIISAAQTAFGTQGLPAPSRDAILSGVGLSLPRFMARLAPEASAEDLVAAYKRAYHDLVQSNAVSPLYPGMRDLLTELGSETWTMLGVATGKSRRGLTNLLKAHGLTQTFITTQVADDHPSKPSPSMLFRAMEDAGVEPVDTVMIGDTSFDMEMAKAAGVNGLGVTWGYHERTALGAAHALVDDVAGLRRILIEGETT